MRIVFMGTPESAVVVLQRLVQSQEHQVLAVVTQADKPSGRGRKFTPSPVKLFAQTHNIPILQPERLKGNTEIITTLASYTADLFVVVAYGKILPPEILSLPKFGCVNVHFSLLPKYRGAAPVQWAIINGEKTTGVTIMKMNERMDEGEILAQEEVEILDDDDTVSLTNILSCLGAELLIKVLAEAQETQRLAGIQQDHSRASYAPKLKKEDGLLDWAKSKEEIICRIKGLYPWPCAYTYLEEKLVKILGAEPASPEIAKEIAGKEMATPQPGTVVAISKRHGFYVQTGDGFLLITKLQPEDKRIMSGADFVNGGYVKIGTKFKSLPSAGNKNCRA